MSAGNQFRIARDEIRSGISSSTRKTAGVRCGLINGANRVAKRSRSSGENAAFTLIELALSIFVMGVAVLGVFSLARIGISTSMEAEDEMRAAQFADDVFTTLRLYSDAFQDTNRWDSFDGDLASYAEGLSASNNLFYCFWTRLSENKDVDFICLPDFWDRPEDGSPLGSAADETPYPIRMQIVGPDESYYDDITTNIFCAADIRSLGDMHRTIPEYAIRYRLIIVTNSTSHVSANLNVWCGLDSRQRNDYTFYTHFFARGNLP